LLKVLFRFRVSGAKFSSLAIFCIFLREVTLPYSLRCTSIFFPDSSWSNPICGALLDFIRLPGVVSSVLSFNNTSVSHVVFHLSDLYCFPTSKSSPIDSFRTLCWSDFLSVLLQTPFLFLISGDSVVGIATGYGLDDRGVGVPVPIGSRMLSSPRRPHRFCGPPSLLSNGYRGLFPRR
jgi:hypothetical protein